MLGFVVKSMGNQLALADGASHHRKDRSTQADGTVFVHCYEMGNQLSKTVDGLMSQRTTFY